MACGMDAIHGERPERPLVGLVVQEQAVEHA
jgi:hypothetical protein